HNLPSGVAWLEPRRGAGPRLTSRAYTQRALAFLFLGPFALLIHRDNIMAAFHILLILANTAIITGGSFLANADFSQFNSPDTQSKLRTSRIARTAGQSVFLACNTLLLVILLITARGDRRIDGRKGGIHPTILLLLIAWIPLTVRGAFGVIQSADFELSYFNRSPSDTARSGAPLASFCSGQLRPKRLHGALYCADFSDWLAKLACAA
ncbi:hypothetical protein DFH06DRAFT_1384571, partial [Mycena polygramma]